MDIIVTTPKSRMADAAKEAIEARGAIDAGGEAWYFRSLGPSKPTKINEGDLIFYVEDGWVRGFAVIASITNDPGHVCDTTGRQYGPGWYAVMPAWSWYWIEPIAMRGFQGWRYFDAGKHGVRTIGTWRDPKPSID